ncbi:MAG: chemotaxis-specific protein-glutamate methyltransferase CheB [Gammaproteobacteria bacterium]|nr:chemotaxis-specific protein-glutamate methyltransferase CheB [Gammaproteobacteria bacterium]
MIKVLIAEDSDVVALLLKTIFEQQPDLQVIGRARNGREAVQMCNELQPDIVTMDIRMPVMDGFEATRMIMANNPLPIVVISSSVDNEEMRITFRAIEEGALAVLEKPHGFGHPDFEAIRKELVDTVRAMAEVKVIRRSIVKSFAKVDIFETAIHQKTRASHIVALGSSTGGPQVLQSIFSSLPIGFPVPIVCAQHISKGFIGGLVQWLNGNTLLGVKVAEQSEHLLPGIIYFAPDDYHLRVKRNGSGLVVNLTQDPPMNGFRPSATPLFQSLAEHCAGHAIAGLLTGMGGDGAQGLLEARQAGCHTFVQDEESAVVYGMPGTALALGAADQVVDLDKIAAYCTSLVRE